MRYGATKIKGYSQYEIRMITCGEWSVVDLSTEESVKRSWNPNRRHSGYDLLNDDGNVDFIEGGDIRSLILPYLRDTASYSSDIFHYPPVDINGSHQRK